MFFKYSLILIGSGSSLGWYFIVIINSSKSKIIIILVIAIVFKEAFLSIMKSGKVIPTKDPTEGAIFKRVINKAFLEWYLNFYIANSN